ncbi:HET-domain-containing protein [Cubamyces sp. BRFM 1775]|nr:HET-domain-containing protein [Cubamyces sp. BRFM 1775]
MRRTFCIYTSSDDPAASWLPEQCASLSIANTGSLRALRLAKSSVDKCMREHDRCKATSLHPFGQAPLPRRVVDCSNLTRPRLVETNSGAKGAYVALSYVWGEDQPHRTTQSNLCTYVDGMNPEGLPQTIRDAVFVTRILGYQFLWVDSLCILQDSVEDKEREIGSMRDVYRQAVLTIDAASAAKVSEGFLHERRPHPQAEALPFIPPPSQYDRNSSSLRVGTIYLARAQICARARDNVVTRVSRCGCQWETRLDSGQTGRRAWCLQEALMSCRSLVFTANTVQLRCQTATQAIGGTYHATALDGARLPGLLLSSDPQRTRAGYGSPGWTQVHQAWCSVVQDYTHRGLSEPSDKLVACAGLAEEFARFLQSEYLAGLWRDSLFDDLLWVRSSREPLRLPRPLYRAPTWSWASVDGEVTWLEGDPSDGLEVLANVVGCTVTLQHKTLPFGQVVDGSLVLRAKLYPCGKRHAERKDGGNATISPLVPIRSHRPLAGSTVLGPENPRFPMARFGVRMPFIQFDSADDDMADQCVWAVPFRRTSRMFHGPRTEGMLVGRVKVDGSHPLRSDTESMSRQRYRRVGYFVVEEGDIRALGYQRDEGRPQFEEIEVI